VCIFKQYTHCWVLVGFAAMLKKLTTVIDELQNVIPIEVDEDNMLCDEAARSESCIT
jgi:hypothetical protein